MNSALIVDEYVKTSASTRDLAKKFATTVYIVRKILRENGIDAAALKAQKISDKKKGRPSPRLGAKHTDETKRKLSEIRKGVAVTVGYKFTQEQKSKMSASAQRRLSGDPDHLNRARAAKTLISETERKTRQRLRSKYKNLVRRVLRQTKSDKRQRSHIFLGYTAIELRESIEKQFVKGMRFCERESFHIDHIVPVDAFIRHKITAADIVSSICNLRPLSPRENRLRGCEYDDTRFETDLAVILDKNLSNEEKRARLLAPFSNEGLA